VPAVSDPRRAPLPARIEARLWTGPAAHLLGGGLDLLEAIARHALAGRAAPPWRVARALRATRRRRHASGDAL